MSQYHLGFTYYDYFRMMLILLCAVLLIHRCSSLPVNTGHYPNDVDGSFFEGSVLESNEIPFDEGTEDVGQSYSTLNDQFEIDERGQIGDASSVDNTQANEQNSEWEGYYKDASSENGNTNVEDVGQSSSEVSDEASPKEPTNEFMDGDGSINSNEIFGFEDLEASHSKSNTEEESIARGGKMLRPLTNVMYSAAQLARFGIISASNSDAEWSYKGTTGFEYWGSYNYNCLGNSQSPINIDSELVKSRSTDGNRITFTNYERVNKQTTRLENNGHSVELKVTSSSADFMPTLSGGHLKFDFHMIQLHFHWAKNNYAGSEHTINRRRFPLEMHLVHITPEDTSLAVAGFVFRIVADTYYWNVLSF